MAMRIITKMLKQTCVYWALESAESAGDDYDDYGQPQQTAPVELSCRWETVTEEFLDKNGTVQLSQAKVYVGQDVDLGGVLMLGGLADITDSSYPKENEGAWEIKRFEKLPTLKADQFLRTVFL